MASISLVDKEKTEYIGFFKIFHTPKQFKLNIPSFTCDLQARSGITEIHFLPFNPVEKRTAITYIDSDGNWHRVSKGAPEQVMNVLLAYTIPLRFFIFLSLILASCCIPYLCLFVISTDN